MKTQSIFSPLSWKQQDNDGRVIVSSWKRGLDAIIFLEKPYRSIFVQILRTDNFHVGKESVALAFYHWTAN